MNLTSQARHLEKLVLDNSPLLLTAIGVTGTITTALLTGKAAFKANSVIWQERYVAGEENHELTQREKVELTWKLYIPAVATGATTITCIIFANRIGARRTAALAAAYSLSEKGWAEYKEKVLEKLGAKQETAIRDEVAQDRVKKNPPIDAQVIITGNGDVLCYDSLTGRYFHSQIETIKKAMNDTNYQILHNMYASLGDFYDRVGLPTTPYSEEVGWNADEMLDITFSTSLTDDSRPCIVLDYNWTPIRGFQRLQ